MKIIVAALVTKTIPQSKIQPSFPIMLLGLSSLSLLFLCYRMLKLHDTIWPEPPNNTCCLSTISSTITALVSPKVCLSLLVHVYSWQNLQGEITACKAAAVNFKLI